MAQMVSTDGIPERCVNLRALIAGYVHNSLCTCRECQEKRSIKRFNVVEALAQQSTEEKEDTN